MLQGKMHDTLTERVHCLHVKVEQLVGNEQQNAISHLHVWCYFISIFINTLVQQFLYVLSSS